MRHEELTDGVTPALQFAHAILLEAETSPANEIPFLGPKNVRRRGLRHDGRLRDCLYCIFISYRRHLTLECRFAHCKFWHQ